MGYNRRKMDKSRSMKLFSRTAGVNRVHPKNHFREVASPVVMRGGFRI